MTYERIESHGDGCESCLISGRPARATGEALDAAAGGKPERDGEKRSSSWTCPGCATRWTQVSTVVDASGEKSFEQQLADAREALPR